PSGSSHKYGTVATFSCEIGYNLQGSATRTCQGDSQWSGAVPVCQTVQCPSLTNPDGGSVSAAATQYQSVATYSCSVGFFMQGSTTRTCQANGQWSGSNPTCTRKFTKCTIIMGKKELMRIHRSHV
ncbi:hypothetical protein CAPTEDRAFT_119142, partial [Capitella teleta]